MKSFFKKILLGDTEVTEYSTVTIPDEIKEHVFLEAGKFVIDISKIHWLLCLEPVMFGIWLTRAAQPAALAEKMRYTLYFSGSSSDDFKIAKRNAVAVIALEYFDKIDDADGTLYLLKLTKSKIYHAGFLKTRILFFKYYKKPKLSFEKYKSLISAYSYPRRVRIISFKEDGYFNIFPMDLLGEIPQSGKHVFGLRHTNTTLARIIDTKRIVVSEVPYIYKDIIYELGKHHGANPPAADSLPFRIKQTDNFGFPIPEWADNYKEVRILKTRSLGSHMLLWGEIINQKTLKPSSGNLYHIHFLLYYHQKLKGPYYRLI